MDAFFGFLTGVFMSVGTFFGVIHSPTLADLPVIPPAPAERSTSQNPVPTTVPHPTDSVSAAHDAVPPTPTVDQTGTKPVNTAKTSSGLSQSDLLAMASNAYPDGSVPVGDYKYVTDAPKKGYVYLCNVHKDNPGSMVNGPWMHGVTWNYKEKVSIDGSVMWPNANFSDVISGAWRMLTGNGLPVGYPTGVFPVASTDDAHQYDANPNTIKSQTLSQKFPVSPTYSDTPYCMGGEVGVMTTGVPLFNAFDAGLRDAPAHELQDTCDGHPQGSGEYHYHALSGCFKDITVSTVLGYALDGYPITGPEVASGKYLTTDDLDVCHGLTSEVTINGKKTMTYHYVMTRDFPYSVSCFHAKPVSMMVIQGAMPQQGQSPPSGGMNQSPQAMPPQGNGPMGGPPQAAIAACSGGAGASCSFSDDHGSHSGMCQSLPDGQVACVPH